MGAGHDHHTGSNRARLGTALAITATVLVAEVVGAWITGSLALLVDAGHMLTDVGGLLMALLAATAMTKPPTAQPTWGWARIEILAAGAQAAILLAVGIFAFVEGLQRLLAPPDIAARGMLLLGILGLTANIASVWVLSGGRDHNLNMRAAFLEVVNDAFGSIAVIASALVIQYTGWTQADALAGMLISILIVPRALRILRQAGSVLLETVPEGLHLDDVRTFQLETSQPHQPRKRHPRLKQRPRGRERGVRFRDEGQHRSNTVVSRRRGFRLPPTLFGTLTSARTTL
jgi:cobalt-zinc-cadmium efflux system protein